MKQLVTNKYNVVLCLITIAMVILAGCTNNMFTGISAEPDIHPPTLKVVGPTNNEIVSGTFTISGTVKDDIEIKKVEIFLLSTDASGDSIKETLASMKPDGSRWELTIDSLALDLDDGIKVFKIKVTDKTGKEDSQNLTLQLDNYGPVISITRPLTAGTTFYNPFTVSLICLDSGKTERLSWTLTSLDDPTVTISGEVTDDTIDINYSFLLYPQALEGMGDSNFSNGICRLSIIGYDDKGNVTKTPGYLDMMFDFSNDTPQVELSSPEETDIAEAKIYGTKVTIMGQAIDDDGIAKVEIHLKEKNDSDFTITDSIPDTPDIFHSFSIPFEHLMDGGEYEVKLRAFDSNGAMSNFTESHYFIVNSQYPVVDISSPLIGTWYKEMVNVIADVYSTSNRIVKIEKSLDDSTWTTIYDDATGVASYSYNDAVDSTTLPGGSIKYYIRATDNLGFVTKQDIIFNIDNEIPICSIISPGEINTDLNETIKIEGTALDELDAGKTGIIESLELRFEIPDNADLIVEPEGTANWYYYFDTTVVTAGSVTLHVTVTDAAGNTYTTQRTININQAADIPAVSVNSFADGDKIFGVNRISGIASDDDSIKYVEVQVDGTDAGSWERASGMDLWYYVLDATLLNRGLHTLYCIAYDDDEVPSPMFDITFDVDPDSPIINFSGIAENDYINGDKTLQVNISKNNGTIEAIEVQLTGTNRSTGETSHVVGWTTDGIITTANNADQDLTCDFTIDTTYWGEGPLAVSFKAKDDLDKITVATRNIKIDTIEPTAALTLPVANQEYTDDPGYITFIGTSDDSSPSGTTPSGILKSNLIVQLEYNDTGDVQDIITDATLGSLSGSVSDWSLNWLIPDLQKDGLYTLTYRVLDNANNSITSPITVNNIRIAQYPPQFTGISINNKPVSDGDTISQECTFTGTISDVHNSKDVMAGIATLEIYQSNDAVVDAGDGAAILSHTYSGTNATESFPAGFTHTFTTGSSYLIFRAVDKIGGITDYPVSVVLDYQDPVVTIEYSSEGFYPTTTTDSPLYSASFWVEFNVSDDNALTGTKIEAQIGTSIGDDDLVPYSLYDINSGNNILKADFKGLSTDPIYLWYRVKDLAGNEATADIQITLDGVQPTVNSGTLEAPGGAFLNQAALNGITGTATGGGQAIASVKYTAPYADTRGFGTLYDATNVSGDWTDWSMNITPPASDGEYLITVLVTAVDGTNTYKQFAFTYDNTDPATTFTIEQIDESGRVIGDDLSGTVRLSGTFSDEYYNATKDFTLSIDVDGGAVTINNGDITTTQVSGSEFEWYYDWDTTTHPDVVKNTITITLSATDTSGNIATTNLSGKNLKPYILYIKRESGVIIPVSQYDTVTQTWMNTNDNETYTYRMGAGNVTVVGYNLNGTGNEVFTFTPDNGTADTTDDNYGHLTQISAPIQEIATSNGTLKITVNSIDSNSKYLYIIENYDAQDYTDTAEMDMVMDDSNMAMIAVQKHWQDIGEKNITRNGMTYSVNANGSCIYTFKETSKGTFNRSMTETSTGDNLVVTGYNRYWFITVTKDLTLTSSTQNDALYYVLYDDSENYAAPGITPSTTSRGLQLMGSKEWWSNNANYDIYDHSNSWQSVIWNPYNDHPVPAGPTDDDPANEWHTYRDRWRLGADDSLHDDGDDSDNDADQDWSIKWGDIVANNNYIHATFYDAATSTLKYRSLFNEDESSDKTPEGKPLEFTDINGNYPKITVDTVGNPVIVAFDQDNGNLIGYVARVKQPTAFDDTTNFHPQYTFDSNGVTGQYPDIKIDANGYHIAYHDKTYGKLRYKFGADATALESASSVVLDADAVPGYYCHLELVDGKPMITYLAYGYLGTKDAIRVARYKGTVSAAEFVKPENWEVLTLPCEREITDNKVRGFQADDGGTRYIFGFGKSDRPEFFREQL